jgi:hypothetical protein
MVDSRSICFQGHIPPRGIGRSVEHPSPAKDAEINRDQHTAIAETYISQLERRGIRTGILGVDVVLWSVRLRGKKLFRRFTITPILKTAIVRNGTMFAFLNVVLALSTLHAVAKDEFHYEAASCKMDAKGHLYIALGRYVLAVPFLESRTYVLDSVPPNERLPAPDPAEQEGCPGNPSQQRSFAFYFGAPLVDTNGDSSKPAHREAPTRLTLYAVWKPNPNADRDHPEWSGESLTDSVVRSTCARASVRETFPNGLTACRIQPIDKSRVEDWAASYISDPSIYATPLGRPFMVDCGPRLYSDGISHCKVAYSIAHGLAVGYEFQPYLDQSPIPIDHIIEVDRRIRAQIDAATVKDFIWPNQKDDNRGTAGGKP